MLSSNSDLKSLAARVESLETQFSSLKAEVETERVVLKDADGKTRATLCTRDGGPGLDLYDTNGNRRVFLRILSEGLCLHLSDAETKQGMELRVTMDGPAVSLFDTNGNNSVLAAITEDVPWVGIYDASGKPRLTLNVSKAGPCLMLTNANGNADVCVTALENGPSVSLTDPANTDGNTGVRLQVDEDGPILLCIKEGKVLWSAY